MPMRWDPLLAAATARELSVVLDRARVRALLLDPDARRVILFLREHTLVMELHPLRGWITLHPAREPHPGARPLAARVRSVRTLPDESAFVFQLPRVRGRDEGVELIAEMVGNQWNAMVVGHRSRVIRHVLVPRERGSRTLTVGMPYTPPPSTNRAGVDRNLDLGTWNRILEQAGDDREFRRKALLRAVAWTSSLNVDALLEPDGWQRWQGMTDPDGWSPCILDTPRGLQPYPVSLDVFKASAAPTFMDAFRTARGEDAGADALQALLAPRALLDRGSARVERLRSRVAALRRELERTADPDPIRSIGDLILARFADVPRGVERVELIDFDGEPQEIELDPGRSPHENAARYYDEAARVERARTQLPERIERAEVELHRWEGLLSAVQEGRAPVSELAEALGPDDGHATRKTHGSTPSLPYHRLVSSGGLEIRVGRGARHNDALTFHHSDPSDVWLHVRQAAGAHVILRWTRDEAPPARNLAEAATAAATHSEARHSGNVAVDWTRRKYVRKPRKAPPGAVVPNRVQTVFVDPDPALVERLSAAAP